MDKPKLTVINGTPANIESAEVVEQINALIESGVNPDDIDYDEIVYQANLQKSKGFYKDKS